MAYFLASTYQAMGGYAFVNDPGGTGDVMDSNTATYVEQTGAVGGVVAYSLLFQIQAGQELDTAFFDTWIEDSASVAFEISNDLRNLGGGTFVGTWTNTPFLTGLTLIANDGVFTRSTRTRTFHPVITCGSNTWYRFSIKNTDSAGVATKLRLVDFVLKMGSLPVVNITRNVGVRPTYSARNFPDGSPDLAGMSGSAPPNDPNCCLPYPPTRQIIDFDGWGGTEDEAFAIGTELEANADGTPPDPPFAYSHRLSVYYVLALCTPWDPPNLSYAPSLPSYNGYTLNDPTTPTVVTVQVRGDGGSRQTTAIQLPDPPENYHYVPQLDTSIVGCVTIGAGQMQQFHFDSPDRPVDLPDAVALHFNLLGSLLGTSGDLWADGFGNLNSEGGVGLPPETWWNHRPALFNVPGDSSSLDLFVDEALVFAFFPFHYFGTFPLQGVYDYSFPYDAAATDPFHNDPAPSYGVVPVTFHGMAFQTWCTRYTYLFIPKGPGSNADFLTFRPKMEVDVVDGTLAVFWPLYDVVNADGTLRQRVQDPDTGVISGYNPSGGFVVQQHLSPLATLGEGERRWQSPVWNGFGVNTFALNPDDPSSGSSNYLQSYITAVFAPTGRLFVSRLPLVLQATDDRVLDAGWTIQKWANGDWVYSLQDYLEMIEVGYAHPKQFEPPDIPSPYLQELVDNQIDGVGYGGQMLRWQNTWLIYNPGFGNPPTDRVAVMAGGTIAPWRLLWGVESWRPTATPEADFPLGAGLDDDPGLFNTAALMVAWDNEIGVLCSYASNPDFREPRQAYRWYLGSYVAEQENVTYEAIIRDGVVVGYARTPPSRLQPRADQPDGIPVGLPEGSGLPIDIAVNAEGVCCALLMEETERRVRVAYSSDRGGHWHVGPILMNVPPLLMPPRLVAIDATFFIVWVDAPSYVPSLPDWHSLPCQGLTYTLLNWKVKRDDGSKQDNGTWPFPDHIPSARFVASTDGGRTWT